MGGGTWTRAAYTNYVSKSGFSSLDDYASASTRQIYTVTGIHKDMDPYGVIRECVDTQEHPNTIPVILALDVTGSMGNTASMVAKKLNDIMETLYAEINDVEFMIMGIGDLSYDEAPIQAGQFESDIRIAEQTSKIYFEGHGGGNSWESYTAAWYFGLNRTKLDCWKRGRKGIIITLGDEPMNPYLPGKQLARVLDLNNRQQADVETKDLYLEAKEKFDIYHIAVEEPGNSCSYYKERIDNSFGKLLGDHLIYSNLQNLHKTISSIVISNSNNAQENYSEDSIKEEDGMISW